MGCRLHIFIVTAESPDKCAPALGQIWPDLVPGVCVTVLSGQAPAATGDVEKRFSGVCLHHHPGESVWHLRQRMGELLVGSEWMVLLEDHNLPLPGWLPSLCEQVAQAEDHVGAIFGATCNQTSIGPWDWANYLAVQVFHWAPHMSPAVYPLPFNAAVRVASLPPPPWAVGTLEQALPQLAPHGRMSGAFVVDHIQHRVFPSVLGYHFANGRASGATLRSHARQPAVQLGKHMLHVLLVRPWRGWKLIRRHPQRTHLPPFTCWRLPLLLAMHACGTVVGFVAGSGRSMWQLE